MTITATSSVVGSLVRAALTTRTGTPVEQLGDEVPLSDIGLDSLDLIELLVSVQEQIADEYGLGPEAVGDPDGLPWLETVGDLVELVTTSAVDAGVPAGG